MSYIIAIISSFILLGSNFVTTNLEAAPKSSSKSSSRILPKKSECSLLKADSVIIFNDDNNITWHAAFYPKGGALKHKLMVMTVGNDPSRRLKAGSQVILYDSDFKQFSEASTWFFQTINGVSYQCYEQKDCLTYSTDFEQFIVITK